MERILLFALVAFAQTEALFNDGRVEDEIDPHHPQLVKHHVSSEDKHYMQDDQLLTHYFPNFGISEYHDY